MSRLLYLVIVLAYLLLLGKYYYYYYFSFENFPKLSQRSQMAGMGVAYPRFSS